MSQVSGRKSLVQTFNDMINDNTLSRESMSLEQRERPTARRRGPLHGTAVCLSGLPSETKEKMHRFVENLGGR